MQSTTGCKINVSQPSGADVQREIGLVGSQGAIDAAKRFIMEKVDAVVSLRTKPFFHVQLLINFVGTKEQRSSSTSKSS